VLGIPARGPGRTRHGSATAVIWTVFVLTFTGTATVAVVTLARSGLWDGGRPSLTDEQFKAIWTFIGAGLAASVSLLAALSADVRERQAAARQTLEAVIRGLDVVGEKGRSPRAAVAGGLAALVELGHPVVAIRTLSAALTENTVDNDTTAWLLGHLLRGEGGAGTTADLAAARTEAAALLRSTAGDLTKPRYPGNFAWPSILHGDWPRGLPPGMDVVLMEALVRLLTSQRQEWWDGGRGTGWVPDTLAAAERTVRDERARVTAAAYRRAIEEAVVHDPSTGGALTLDDPRFDVLDQRLKRQICAWAGRNGALGAPAHTVRTRVGAHAIRGPL